MPQTITFIVTAITIVMTWLGKFAAYLNAGRSTADMIDGSLCKTCDEAQPARHKKSNDYSKHNIVKWLPAASLVTVYSLLVLVPSCDHVYWLGSIVKEHSSSRYVHIYECRSTDPAATAVYGVVVIISGESSTSADTPLDPHRVFVYKVRE